MAQGTNVGTNISLDKSLSQPALMTPHMYISVKVDEPAARVTSTPFNVMTVGTTMPTSHDYARSQQLGSYIENKT